jgi:hypothetical protein
LAATALVRRSTPQAASFDEGASGNKLFEEFFAHISPPRGPVLVAARANNGIVDCEAQRLELCGIERYQLRATSADPTTQ